MSAPSIRGHQGRIKFLRNGADAKVTNITSFEANQDSTMSRSFYVGNPLGEGDQTAEGWSGSLDAEVKDSAIDDLIDALVSGNLLGLGVEDVAFILDENYADGTIRSYVYFGIQAKMSKRVSGLNEKQTKRLDWQAAGRILL